MAGILLLVSLLVISLLVIAGKSTTSCFGLSLNCLELLRSQRFFPGASSAHPAVFLV
ncbi:hypothetical protein X975_10683, partial [Stegodyphus mimosarum]